MLLTDHDIERFDTLHIQNIEAVWKALGTAVILHWKDIPASLRTALLKTADLIEPINKNP